jgi:hypothetical protein
VEIQNTIKVAAPFLVKPIAGVGVSINDGDTVAAESQIMQTGQSQPVRRSGALFKSCAPPQKTGQYAWRLL